MPTQRLKRRVVRKSTGGALLRAPEPVDPADNLPHFLTLNTVALPL